MDNQDGSFTTTFDEAIELGVFDPYQFIMDDYEIVAEIQAKGKFA